MRYESQEFELPLGSSYARSPPPHADPPGFTHADHAINPNRSVSRCWLPSQTRTPSTRCLVAHTTPWIRAGTERGNAALTSVISSTR